MLFMMIADENDRLEVENLYYEHRGLLFSIALGAFRSKETAEDIVQEIFVRVIRHYEKLKPFPCPQKRNYIVTICKNVIKDTFKKRSGVVVVEDESALTPYEIATAANPLDIIISEETVARMTAAIEWLGESYRDVFLLKRVYHFSREEIADLLNISVEAVKKRLVRAKVKIIEQLKEEDVQNDQEK